MYTSNYIQGGGGLSASQVQALIDASNPGAIPGLEIDATDGKLKFNGQEIDVNEGDNTSLFGTPIGDQ